MHNMVILFMYIHVNVCCLCEYMCIYINICVYIKCKYVYMDVYVYVHNKNCVYILGDL